MRKCYKKVAVAGSFTIIHLGHLKLLEKAFEVGNNVIIGLTSDEYVKRKGYDVSFDKRKENLEKILKRYNKKYEIIRINGPFDYIVDADDVEAIVVSEETYERAVEINKLRKERGKKPLDIIVVKMVLAKNGKPISSSRIKKGEIDVYGNVLKYDKG